MRSASSAFALVVLVAASAAAEDAAQRIVTLGSAVTETVFDLGAGEHVVGVDDSSLHPAATKSKARVGYYRMVPAEGVLSLRPTLVVATEEAGPPAALAQLRAAGVRVEIVPSAHSVDAAKTRLLAVAKAIGREEKGAQLTAAIERKLAALRKVEGTRVLFLFGHGRGTLQVAGRDTAADAMLRLVGAVNVVDGYAGYKPLTAEAAIAARPDVILTTTGALRSAGGESALWKQAGLAATPAGKKRRLVVLDDAYLLGFGPRLADAAIEVAEALR